MTTWRRSVHFTVQRGALLENKGGTRDGLSLKSTMPRSNRLIVSQPPTSSAEECISSWQNSSGCSPKWDEFLCWPHSENDVMVAIPCNASDPFVQIVKDTRPDISHIPGRYTSKCMSQKRRLVYISVLHRFGLPLLSFKQFLGE